MSGIKKSMCISGVMMALAMIGGIMNSRQGAARADGGPTVTIAGPLPVPVSGTVSAQQSGAWSVGINGIPSVNVASLPALNLAGGGPLNVANTASSPLYVLNLGDHGRSPYQGQGTCDSLQVGSCFHAFSVPPGHRLVLEHITGVASYLSTPSAVQLFVFDDTPGGFTASFMIPVQKGINGFAESDFDQPVQMYFDTYGFNVQILTAPNLTVPFLSTPHFLLSGYLLDCTNAPCSPITR